MTKPLLFCSVLFFFLFFSINAQAYLPVSINTSFTPLNEPRLIRCENITGTLYCYIAAEGGLSRFNATLTGQTNCLYSPDLSQSVSKFAISDSATVSVGFGSNIYAYNVSSIAGGTCANITTTKTAVFSVGQVNPGALYTTANYTYWAGWYGLNSLVGYAEIKYNIPNTSVIAEWTALEGWTDIALPNMSDNTTFWAGSLNSSDDQNLHKFVNGVETDEVANFSTLYGIDCQDLSGHLCAWDMVKVDSKTTWIYIFQQSGNRLYRANWSAAEAVGLATSITAVSPADNQSFSSVSTAAAQLKVHLKTDTNGTIAFWLNGTNIGNTSITDAPVDEDQYYSTYVLTNAQYIWNASYTDSYGNTFWTSNEYFMREATTAITTVAQNLADAFGIDLDSGKVLFGLLISLVMAGALAYWVKWQLFLPGMMVCMVFFSFVGFFPSWMSVIMIVIAAAIFAKYAGLMK